MVGPKRYFQEVIHQGKKVRWPSFSEFMRIFTVVLVILIIAGLILMFENWTGLTLMNNLKGLSWGIVTSVESSVSA